MRNSISLTTITLFVIVTLAGCSSRSSQPPTYPVTGSVTWKGKPVPNATVVLIPAGGAGQESAAGVTDASGKFQLTTYNLNDGAHAGEYQVKVSQYDTKPPSAKNETMTIEEEQKLAFSGQEIPTPPSKNLLPKKYESEATSGITHTVTEGPTTLEITIQ
jgi:hypothetical protein